MYKFEVCSSCAVCVQAKTEGTVKLLILPLTVAHFLFVHQNVIYQEDKLSTDFIQRGDH